MDRLFTEDFTPTPYWWETMPRPDIPVSGPPARADVAIVGSGYTGLSAAIETARGGRHTVVLDAEATGWGCSTRNGGQVTNSVKPGFRALAKRHGRERALAILREGHNALDWVADGAGPGGIDCDFRRVGRFYAAHTPRRYEALAHQIADQPPGLEQEAHAVPRAEQHREIGSDLYHGGVVFPRHASLDPARFHRGLLDRARDAGAEIVPDCAVTAMERDGVGFRLHTARGTVAARDVLIATGGYGGRLSRWHGRRVIPIGSYIIATETLAPEVVDRLIPNDRVITDTRKLVVYYRASPDRRRILFGARVSIRETDPRSSAGPLHAELTRRFPGLAETRISHSWMGFIAYTFDALPHVGKHDGIHYAMGYCGSGIALAAWLGSRVGLQILGREEGRTALDGLAFPSRPYYWGSPWFLAPTVRYYRWRDELGA